MKAIGLDIGTTTVCGVLVDAKTGELLDAKTLTNDSVIESVHTYERTQDADKILVKCKNILEEYLSEQEDIVSIGVTGQMHGIVYVDENGVAVSPLYTWQDGRGDLVCADIQKKQPVVDSEGMGNIDTESKVADNSEMGDSENIDSGNKVADNAETGESGNVCMTYAAELSKITGYHMASGFGLTTNYYNTKHGLVPEEAKSFCTIPDYVAMSLAGEKRPKMHQTMAASLGLYNMKAGDFDRTAAEKAGMNPELLPEVATISTTCGNYTADVEKYPAYAGKTIPVAVAFGDNQASFLGSVNQECKVLLNVGTGGQVSVYSEELIKADGIECRPYLKGSYLMAGSSLCGGYSYNLVKRFFEEIYALAGVGCPKDIYSIMNRIAGEAAEKEKTLAVDTRFNGSRENPALTGSITGLTVDTFHPGDLAYGVLRGLCEELYQFYNVLPEKLKDGSHFVGSGNGIRKNPLLQKIASDRFRMKLRIPKYAEEAAYGAVLFSLLASGERETLEDVQRLIRYEA